MKSLPLVDGWAALLGLIAPERCRYCQSAAAAEICDGCRAELPWNRPACPRCAQPQTHAAPCRRCARRPPAFDVAWTAFVHAPPVRAGVLRLKYHAGFEQAALLGRLMAWSLSRRDSPLPERLLPVPLHARRLAGRGYNQALEIARVLSRELSIPLDASTLVCARPARDQIGQTAAQRRRNMRGAFAARRALDGLHVALIDDVMTTGATFDALARVARAAGAARIEVWAAARTP